MLLIHSFWASSSRVDTIPYSQFEQLLIENKIDEVSIGADSVQGKLKEALPDGKEEFYTVRVDPQLADKLAIHNVTVKGVASSGAVTTILSWLVPMVVF